VEPPGGLDDVMTFGAILLAGGRATRVDGADKPLFDVGGRTLLARAIEAARVIGAEPITAVGPRPDVERLGIPLPVDVEWTREAPPFGGPAAAVLAGLRSWDTASLPTWTLMLASDLPGAGSAVVRLREAIALVPSDTDGVCLTDAGSRPQWLIGMYRTEPLAARAATMRDGGRDASMRALLDGLAIAAIAAPAAETADVDTWEDLERARTRNEEKS
jgi:molybdopterin-guanine dinucleotide biosynthesis protein A